MSEAHEPDQEPGCAHPRETMSFIGHDAEEALLADALRSGRLHHAWLLAGPKGAGKATLAYRFARRLLGAQKIGARPLESSADDGVVRRIAAASHPDLFVLRRSAPDRGGKVRRDIAVDDARALGEFFSLKPAEGGWRVAIIDAADDMNRNAANAILKTLEEPPPRSILLLVAHAPGAMLPTIRSRCRRLSLRPLDDALVAEALKDMAKPAEIPALQRLAGGRPGRAIALHAADAVSAAKSIDDGLRGNDAQRAAFLRALAFDRGGASAGDRLDIVLDLAQDWLRRTAMSDAESEASAKLAAAWFDLEELRSQAEGLGLDPTHALARTGHILLRATAA